MKKSPSPSRLARNTGSPATTGDRADLVSWIAPACLALLILAVPLEWGGRSEAGKALVKILAALSALAVVFTVGERRRCLVLEIPMAGLLIATSITSIVSVSPARSLGELELVLAYSLAFWSALQLPDRFRSWLVSVAIASGALLSLVGLYWWWGSADPSSLLSSTFYNKNPFAGYLILVIPLALGRLASASRREETALYGAIVVFLMAALALTRSRGAVLALGVAVCVYVAFLWWKGGGRRALRVAVPCLVVVLGVAWLPALLSLLGTGGGAQFPQLLHADPGRLAYWRAAWEMGWDRPLLGWGPGVFAEIHPQYQASVLHYSRFAHNHYLQAWAEGGFLLAGAFLALAALALAQLFRVAAREPPESGLPVLAVLAAALAFLLHLVIDVDWGFPADPVLFFVLLGLASAGGLAGGSGVESYGKAPPGNPAPPLRSLRPAIVSYSGLLTACLLLFVVLAGMRTVSAELVERAGELQTGGDLDGARGYLEASRRLDPGSPRTAYALAAWHLVAARRDGERYHLAQARRAASAGARLDPYDPLQRRLLGTVLSESARLDSRFGEAAERELRAAIRLDPFNRPQLYRTLAVFYRQGGRADEAERLLRRAIALYPQEKVNTVIGNYGGTSKEVVASLRNPKYRARQPELEATLGLRREVALLYVELGQALAERGRLRESVAQVERALRVEPYLIPAHRDLGMLFLAQGRLRDARTHFTMAFRLHPQDRLSLLQLARTEMALGLEKQAAGSLRELLRLDPGHREAGLLLGLLESGGPRLRNRASSSANGPFGKTQ